MIGNSRFTIEKLDRQMSLRETVTERLRTSIISGDLVEGELYSAPSLGAAFGVSATPVREAMMDLVREGLVETVKNKGFRITGMTDAELAGNRRDPPAHRAGGDQARAGLDPGRKHPRTACAGRHHRAQRHATRTPTPTSPPTASSMPGC